MRKKYKENMQAVTLLSHLTTTLHFISSYLGREFIIGKTLRRSPLNGELGASMGSIGVISHEPCKPKVSYLH